MNVNDLLHALAGMFWMVTSYMAGAWATAYPWVTGISALLALVVTLHSVTRLVWHWYHGTNTITTPGRDW